MQFLFSRNGSCAWFCWVHLDETTPIRQGLQLVVGVLFRWLCVRSSTEIRWIQVKRTNLDHYCVYWSEWYIHWFLSWSDNLKIVLADLDNIDVPKQLRMQKRDAVFLQKHISTILDHIEINASLDIVWSEIAKYCAMINIEDVAQSKEVCCMYY